MQQSYIEVIIITFAKWVEWQTNDKISIKGDTSFISTSHFAWETWDKLPNACKSHYWINKLRLLDQYNWFEFKSTILYYLPCPVTIIRTYWSVLLETENVHYDHQNGKFSSFNDDLNSVEILKSILIDRNTFKSFVYHQIFKWLFCLAASNCIICHLIKNVARKCHYSS